MSIDAESVARPVPGASRHVFDRGPSSKSATCREIRHFGIRDFIEKLPSTRKKGQFQAPTRAAPMRYLSGRDNLAIRTNRKRMRQHLIDMT
ncbi:hypothetical protein [Methylobacterium soli]|uniref:hypothetical protein n=1 Tax=Methylobacterium soli TaxID=553447 RepID=UPI0012465FC8|nr:hypothetical protein [Methylobacterium soli]